MIRSDRSPAFCVKQSQAAAWPPLHCECHRGSHTQRLQPCARGCYVRRALTSCRLFILAKRPGFRLLRRCSRKSPHPLRSADTCEWPSVIGSFSLQEAVTISDWADVLWKYGQPVGVTRKRVTRKLWLYSTSLAKNDQCSSASHAPGHRTHLCRKFSSISAASRNPSSTALLSESRALTFS